MEFVLCHTTFFSLVVNHGIHHFCIDKVLNFTREQYRVERNCQFFSFHCPFNLQVTLSNQCIAIYRVDQFYANNRLTTYGCCRSRDVIYFSRHFTIHRRIDFCKFLLVSLVVIVVFRNISGFCQTETECQTIVLVVYQILMCGMIIGFVTNTNFYQFL